MVKSCYIHIPFCDSICSYCDFCKVLKKKEWIDTYLDALEREIKEIYQGEVLQTIYIGGGTPSCLSINQLKRLFDILSILKKDKDIEYTIEGNFENTTKEKLELYKEVGINRLSFGIESIKEENQRLLNRIVDKDKTIEIMKISRELGFDNINVDLIYALPKETIEDLENDLDFIFSLEPDHISTYSLIIEDHTVLKIARVKNISEDLDSKMYELICKRMREKNYNHYEISNFSKDGKQSRHNLTYWNNEEYYGFGLGAGSYIHNERITNTRSPNKYIEGDYRREIETINRDSNIEYEILCNLRKQEGIDLEHFKRKYEKSFSDIYDYKYLLENHLLEEKDNHLFIPEDKWYISNEIIIRLLEGNIYD